jgi:RNA polymerase sigma-70 factor (ECF subfamily)
MIRLRNEIVFRGEPDETHTPVRSTSNRGVGLLEAFERELLTLLPRLSRFARSLARDGADADDLVQAALERALAARTQWQPGTRLDAWMLKIMRNCWIDELRRRTRRARTFAAEEEGFGVTVEAGDGRSADRDAVDRAMNALIPEQREVVALVLVEGLSYREAADLLELPIGTLTSRLSRARQALVQRLETAS